MMATPALAARVRQARPEDAAGIRLVATTAWPATYRAILAPDTIAGFLSQNYSLAGLQARLAHPDRISLVAEKLMPPRAGDILGYAFAGARPPYREGKPVTDGEVFALYVMPAAQGQRVGYLLWEAALAALRGQGLRRAWVGVLAANERARAFYERQGAGFDHAEPVTLGTQTLPEIWYALGLEGAGG